MSRRMSCPTSARSVRCPALTSRPDSPDTASVSGRPRGGWRQNLRSATRRRWTPRPFAPHDSATAHRSCLAPKSNPASAPPRATSLWFAELEHVVIGFADGDVSSPDFLPFRERRRQGHHTVNPVLRLPPVRIHFRCSHEFDPPLLPHSDPLVLA